MVTNPIISIPQPKVYETVRIRLTSPILHIGSAVSRLNPYEYVQTGSKVYLPDSDALAKALHSRGRLQDYIHALENREDIKPLLIQSLGENWENARDTDGNLIFPPIQKSNKWVRGQISELRPMIRNGLGQLYIPGSSIKGAIRTAITYCLLRHPNKYHTPVRMSEIERRLREKLKTGELRSKFNQKFSDGELFMDKLFTDFDLRYQNYQPKTKLGPNTDILRVLHVSDSQPLLPGKIQTKTGKSISYNTPVVAEVVVSSYLADRKAKYRATIYAEMVQNVRAEFTLMLDPEMLKWFHHSQQMQLPFNNLSELLQICQEFVQEQWDAEYDYWNGIQNNNHQGQPLDFDSVRDFYENEKCPYNLRIGWGSGMGGTTISWLFSEDLKQDIRDECGIAAPNFEAPKSRRTVMDSQGNIRYVPGWVKLKVL